ARIAEENAREAQRNRYRFSLLGAKYQFDENLLARSEDFLGRCSPGQRQWEWHYLKGLFQANHILTLRQSRPIWAAAYSPDGKTLAYGGEARIITLADAHSGSRLYELRGHSGTIYWLAFSADNRLLASASHDGTVKLWDPRTGTERRSFKFPGEIYGIAF